MERKDYEMVVTEGLRELRRLDEVLYKEVYAIASELRSDLRLMHNMYANPEDRYIATVSIQDDLTSFRLAVKKANRLVKSASGMYVTVFDDYLRTNGGQYALAKQMISRMDLVSSDDFRKKK